MGYLATTRIKLRSWPAVPQSFAHHVPIILGTPTTDRAIRALKESEIDRLATPWACVRKSTLLWAATTRVSAVRADVTTKPIDVTGYEELVHLLTAEVVEPFETLVVKARTKITFTAGHLCCSTLAMDSKDGALLPGLIVTGTYTREEARQCLSSPIQWGH